MPSDVANNSVAEAAIADQLVHSNAHTADKRYAVGREGTPGQGSFMLIILQAMGERIVEARYQSHHCPALMACGDYTATWVENKTIDEAESLTIEEVHSGVGGLPLGREHCPVYAIKALRDALAQLRGTVEQQPGGETQ